MLSLLPEIANKKVIVVIPVFNDTQTIRQVVEELVQQTPFIILVIDDGSAMPVKHYLSGLPVICLRHRINLGQGAALQTGFSYAHRLEPDIVITFDADGQHSVSDLPLLAKPIALHETSVVLGSRFIQAAGNQTPLLRSMILKTARYVNYLLSGILLTDAHNGLRAFSGEALNKILITENRMAHASEILFEIRRHQLSYKEVGVHVHYTDYSKQKGQTAWDSVKILFDLVLHKIFK